MDAKEAFSIITQLARAAPVIGDVGDKRDEALAILEKLVNPEKPKTKHS